jgi:hypothetical protein
MNFPTRIFCKDRANDCRDFYYPENKDSRYFVWFILARFADFEMHSSYSGFNLNLGGIFGNKRCIFLFDLCGLMLLGFFWGIWGLGFEWIYERKTKRKIINKI